MYSTTKEWNSNRIIIGMCYDCSWMFLWIISGRKEKVKYILIKRERESENQPKRNCKGWFYITLRWNQSR